MNDPDPAGILGAVFESAIDGILVIDEHGVIQMANAAVTDLFGYPEDSLVGENVSVLMGREHAARHDGYLQRYLRTGEARIIGVGREVEGRRCDGSAFPFRLSVGELDLPGGRLFTGIVHDLTAERAYLAELRGLAATLENRVEQRTLALEEALEMLNAEIEERRQAERIADDSREDALQALERERELGELKSRFVSLASHEFRTPLATILSSAELLRRYTEAEQQARRERHVDRIRKSVVHLTDVLDDFLSLSRIEEGRVGRHVGPTDLGELADEFADYIAPVLRPRQRLGISAPRVGAEPFLTDPKFVRAILTNLVSNAAKYSSADAEIALRLAVAAARGGQPRALEIEVADRGIGIPRAEQPRLFDRFFRATNVENVQGTGLGLHIVRRYVELLDGEIGFVSEEGVGTTFTVRLPEREEEGAGATVPRER